MNMPIVRLTLDGMKYAVAAALNEHVLNIEDEVKKALDEFVAEDTIPRMVTKIVRDEVSAAISEEVQRFFRETGIGRQAIRQAVDEHMNKMYSTTQN